MFMPWARHHSLLSSFRGFIFLLGALRNENKTQKLNEMKISCYTVVNKTFRIK